MQTVMQSYITFELSLASIYMYITMNSYEDGCRFFVFENVLFLFHVIHYSLLHIISPLIFYIKYNE